MKWLSNGNRETEPWIHVSREIQSPSSYRAVHLSHSLSAVTYLAVDSLKPSPIRCTVYFTCKETETSSLKLRKNCSSHIHTQYGLSSLFSRPSLPDWYWCALISLILSSIRRSKSENMKNVSGFEEEGRKSWWLHFFPSFFVFFSSLSFPSPKTHRA